MRQNNNSIVTERKFYDVSYADMKNKSEQELIRYKKLRDLHLLSLQSSLDLVSNDDKEELSYYTKALYMLSEKERELIEVRYLENSLLDYEAVDLLMISERQYYRVKASALLNYYKNLGTIKDKQSLLS